MVKDELFQTAPEDAAYSPTFLLGTMQEDRCSPMWGCIDVVAHK